MDGAPLKMTKPTTYQFQLHATWYKTVIAQPNQAVTWLDSTHFIAYVAAQVHTRSVQVDILKCDEATLGQV